MLSESNQYLTFFLSNEEYGVDILKVQGIQSWDKVTPIPNTPDYVLGVINLRGIIVPILDLRIRFNLPTADIQRTTVVVIVKVAKGDSSRTVGLVVDAVSDVYSIEASDVCEAPDFGGTVNADYVSGLVTIKENMIILLDVDRLVNADLLRALGGAAEMGEAIESA
ncbi:chemotaxis protein CheW [Porticoccaceae bacterium LTM1]|nr:chemotaxis protein CheW [Porticoccaceae bacterium LTM1]